MRGSNNIEEVLVIESDTSPEIVSVKDAPIEKEDSSQIEELLDKRQHGRVRFRCAVCLDRPDPAVFTQPCGHVFCERCLQNAIQRTKKCPVCRQDMRPRNIKALQFRINTIGKDISKKK